MLEHKGVSFRAVRLPTGLHPLATRLLGFPGPTVPAVRVDGRRVQTNRAIARFLDELRPDPPLFPEDAARRAAVEEAERWADEVFQMAARRLVLAGGVYGRLFDDAEDGPLGPLLWTHRRARRAGVRFVARFRFAITPEAERELLAALPAQLDRVDAWIADGVLNGERLNAADFAIAPSLALLTYRRDLRDEVRARPAGALAARLLGA
jgi:glutathione S-transferase